MYFCMILRFCPSFKINCTIVCYWASFLFSFSCEKKFQLCSRELPKIDFLLFPFDSKDWNLFVSPMYAEVSMLVVPPFPDILIMVRGNYASFSFFFSSSLTACFYLLPFNCVSFFPLPIFFLKVAVSLPFLVDFISVVIVYS